jgi:hypothetical protein
MKILSYLFIPMLISICMMSCSEDTQAINNENKTETFFLSEDYINEVIWSMKEKFSDKQSFRIEKGVNQVAALWNVSDGNFEVFKTFCLNNFIDDENELEIAYTKLERNFEVLFGTFNNMKVKLMEPLHLDTGEIDFIDNEMGMYSPSAHLMEDLFKNKIAFYVALNFPSYSLKEKSDNAEKWSRRDWAYARMGDLFISRTPPELIAKASSVETEADTYIADYNIYMGNLVDNELNTHFPKDLKLITHWGLRDELKTHYNNPSGVEKQRIIYNVMLNVINQEIPKSVINSDSCLWNPMSNKLYRKSDRSEIKDFKSEPNTRYEHLLHNFKAISAMDKYNPIYPTYIERAYDEAMELTQKEVEELFINFISSPEINEIGKLIKSRLGRDLEPFDIWYDGFKARTSINEEELNKITRRKYPTSLTFEKDIPKILVDLGWSNEKAKYIANKISVDPARGAGHAWGAEMKGDVAHLRTRISKSGMDYKGYNIAIHELGHNVEQTITLYDIDYYMLHGVPNTGFTEAVAFLFQANDLKLLGQSQPANKLKTDALAAVDNCWSSYEIMGVALVDMYVWQWMYQNPDANLKELNNAVNEIAKSVWNKYYAPVFGVNDSPILAVYSHMIASPLYLANYPVGHLIEFQIEQHINGNNLADEITRMLLQGRIIPQKWMKGAVNSKISGEPTLNSVRKAISILSEL